MNIYFSRQGSETTKVGLGQTLKPDISRIGLGPIRNDLEIGLFPELDWVRFRNRTGFQGQTGFDLENGLILGSDWVWCKLD